MRRFVTSDSHGGYKALQQCLERCGFDKEQDELIFVGDVVDGWSETRESIDLLLSCRHLTYVLGNHDQWTLEYYTGMLGSRKDVQNAWLRQGGSATISSYGKDKSMPKEHLELLQQAKLYHITEDNILFVHAGFNSARTVQESDRFELLWSRDFIEEQYALYLENVESSISAYKQIYVGHTPTILLNKQQLTPLQMGNVTLIDTGAAFTGCLSIVDIDSKEVWQSDVVMSLYPDEAGRNGFSWNDRNISHSAY